MNNCVKILDKAFSPYISCVELSAAVARCAGAVDAVYAGVEEPVLMLTVLGGAVTFCADLSRSLSINVEWGFVKCSSYGSGMQSCGKVRLTIEPTISVEGRDVLVVEDIVDSGRTWEFLHDYLLKCGAKSVRIATMAIKPIVYKGTLPVDFVALELEDIFVVGSGLDYAGLGRNLDGIYKLQVCSK